METIKLSELFKIIDAKIETQEAEEKRAALLGEYTEARIAMGKKIELLQLKVDLYNNI